MRWLTLGVVLLIATGVYFGVSLAEQEETYTHVCIVDGVRIEDIDEYKFRSGYIEIQKDGVLSTYNGDAICHTVLVDEQLSALHNVGNDILVAIIIKMYLIFIVHEFMREDVTSVKKGLWLLIAPLTYASFIIRHLYAKE